ncbi:MAG: hypothetical protein R3E76_13030 [Planctomycetota bacterium]
MPVSEREWVKQLVPDVRELLKRDASLECHDGLRLPYRHEVLTYNSSKKQEPEQSDSASYQTDLAVIENRGEAHWSPRLIVEVKLESVTTHDAITYSNKAEAHKRVHPYVRYGILIAGCRERFLPNRLLRHGSHFDFMVAWPKLKPSQAEWRRFDELIHSEVKASRTLFTFIEEGGSKGRQRYSWLRRSLELGG